MRTFAALALLGVLCVVSTAQDAPKTVKLSVYGQSSLTAVNELEAALNLRAVYHGVDPDDLNSTCFVTAKGISQEDAASLASFSTGRHIVAEPESGVLHVSALGEPAGRGSVKGYDVSVLGGRYVEYVNTWGAARGDKAAGADDEPERTAAQRLAELIEDLLYDPWSEECRASVVGDRALFTLHAAGHTRVRELLDLLLTDAGGESESLKRERAVVQLLKTANIEAEYEATPISSVLAGICLEAGTGLALGPDMAAISVEHHVELSLSGVTAWDALRLVLDMLVQGGQGELDVSARSGAVAIEIDSRRISTGYHVYNIENLLKKLDASYQRQRTQPGKDAGYNGGLREEGGNQVVVDSLYDLLEAQGRFADCFVYGTRLVVKGSAEAVDAATEILVQMGWEKPKD